jgi:hypothetical protein
VQVIRLSDLAQFVFRSEDGATVVLTNLKRKNAAEAAEISSLNKN